jgi:DNA-binding transcriptional ArsR family regulator
MDVNRFQQIKKLFKLTAPLLLAIADQNRQNILMDISSGGYKGMNVTELTEKNHLSRPAISHHLKILKDCSLVESKKIGTQVYYYLHTERDFTPVKTFINSMEALIHNIETAPNGKI